MNAAIGKQHCVHQTDTAPQQEPKTHKVKTKTATATCDNNQVNYSEGAKHYCCPGKVLGEGSSGGPYCCVGAADVSVSATKSVTCSTTIALSETSYSSLAQAAATSLAGTSSKAGAAAMITSGPLAGALMAAGGLVLAL
jgi:hypothetical protein